MICSKETGAAPLVEVTFRELCDAAAGATTAADLAAAFARLMASKTQPSPPASTPDLEPTE